jgi:hypothetical protein
MSDERAEPIENGEVVGVLGQDPIYSLTDLQRRLDVPYDRLRGFIRYAEVRHWLGARSLPNVQGDRFPIEAELKLRQLLEAQDAGLITPKTAAAWIDRTFSLDTGGELGQDTNGTSIDRVSPQPIANLLEEIRDEIRRLGSWPNSPTDRLIDATEAAGLLCCSPRAVGRRVRPVSRGRWRYSDVQAYIRGLVQR